MTQKKNKQHKHIRACLICLLLTLITLCPLITQTLQLRARSACKPTNFIILYPTFLERRYFCQILHNIIDMYFKKFCFYSNNRCHCVTALCLFKFPILRRRVKFGTTTCTQFFQGSGKYIQGVAKISQDAWKLQSAPAHLHDDPIGM
jgi:hypothetical protein